MRAMAHGYTNNTRGDGEAVVKRYEGAGWQRRQDTSHHDVWQRRLDATLAWTGH